MNKGKKIFKGRCHNCGAYGHKSTDCDEKQKKKNQEKSVVKCGYCGRAGHKEFTCWKRQKDMRSGKLESANQSSDEQAEVVLTSTDEHDNFDENTWIADMGVTMHMTNSL